MDYIPEGVHRFYPSEVVCGQRHMEAVAGALQAEYRHTDAIAHSRRLHHLSAAHAERLHDDAAARADARHREALSAEASLVAASTKMQRDLAQRDAVRDAVAHRSHTTQALLLADAVLLGAAYMMTYQVQLPSAFAAATMTNTSDSAASNTTAAAGIEVDSGLRIAHVVYTIVLALAHAVLVAGALCALFLQQRVVGYDVQRPLRRYYRCGLLHRTFTSYYECHCRLLERVATSLFYVGAVLVTAASAILVGCVFGVSYNSPGPAVLYGVLGAASVAVLALFDVVVPSATHTGPKDYVGGMQDGSAVDGDAAPADDDDGGGEAPL